MRWSAGCHSTMDATPVSGAARLDWVTDHGCPNPGRVGHGRAEVDKCASSRRNPPPPASYSKLP